MFRDILLEKVLAVCDGEHCQLAGYSSIGICEPSTWHDVLDGISHSQHNETIEFGKVGGDALVMPFLEGEELADHGDESYHSLVVKCFGRKGKWLYLMRWL